MGGVILIFTGRKEQKIPQPTQSKFRREFRTWHLHSSDVIHPSWGGISPPFPLPPSGTRVQIQPASSTDNRGVLPISYPINSSLSSFTYLGWFQEKKYTFLSISFSYILHPHEHLHFSYTVIKAKHSLWRVSANTDVMSKLRVRETIAERVLRFFCEETICSTRIVGGLEGWRVCEKW